MSPHAAVVGSGPNGLSAACQLARSGWQVTVYEAAESPGGAAASAELFGAGIISDLGASIHPLSAASPAYEQLLGAHEIEWAQPGIPAAHGVDDEPPVLLHSSLEQTAEGLGRDAELWRRLTGHLVSNWDEVRKAVLTPPSRPFSHDYASTAALTTGSAGRLGRLGRDLPLPGGATPQMLVHRVAALLQLGSVGILPAKNLMSAFKTQRARALLAGLAAHSTTPLSYPLTSAVGLAFGAAGHAGGWPVVKGGSQKLADALVAALKRHGGELRTGFHVTGVHDVARPAGRPGAPKNIASRGWRIEGTASEGSGMRRKAEEIADVVVLDLTPAQVLRVEGLGLSDRTRRALRRWDYGPGVVKIDYLLDGPIPWEHAELGRAGTVHLGGSGGQLIASEAAANRGVLPGRPFVLLAQPSAADETRTPDSRTVCWAYAHVPLGLDAAGTARAAQLIEAEIARQAPAFSQAVLDRKVWGPAQLQSWNPNLIGGSVSSGVASLPQTLAGPVSTFRPYWAGAEGVYLCSAATPPGGGAHGMAGYNAAQTILRERG